MTGDEQGRIEQLEMECFQIVAQVGSARSCYLEAITRAEEGDFEGAQRLVDEGNQMFNAGHDVHMGILQREARGERLPFRIILLHAEDQLMSAEGFRILSEKFIAVYRHMSA